MTRMNWDRAAARQRVSESASLVNPGAGWWLTINGRDDQCAMCGVDLKKGDVVVFGSEVRQTICRGCSREAGIKPEQSDKYKAMKKRGGR